MAAGLAFLGLYDDALAGYHDTLPVYVFAGVAIVCMGIWGYLISKIL